MASSDFEATLKDLIILCYSAPDPKEALQTAVRGLSMAQEQITQYEATIERLALIDPAVLEVIEAARTRARAAHPHPAVQAAPGLDAFEAAIASAKS